MAARVILLLAFAVPFIGCAGEPTPPGEGSQLSRVGDSLRTGSPGQILGGAVQVIATDAQGNPVSGVPITFAVTAGGGSVAATMVSTTDDGVATTF